MRVPKIFKSSLFQCALGIYAIGLLIMYTGSGLIPVAVVNIIMEVNSIFVSYIVYDTYLKKK